MLHFLKKKISFFILNSHGHIFLHSAFQFKHDMMFPLKLDCSVKKTQAQLQDMADFNAESRIDTVTAALKNIHVTGNYKTTLFLFLLHCRIKPLKS